MAIVKCNEQGGIACPTPHSCLMRGRCMNDERIIEEARAEFAEEQREERRRALIDAEKARLRGAKWWHKFVPFVVSIKRRK